jgi:sigma-B regulation protein RsbU (phosphoserine phosphatase)
VGARAVLAVVTAGCVIAALLWGRSSRRLARAARRIEQTVGAGRDAAFLARSSFQRDLHTTLLYALLAAGATAILVFGRSLYYLPFLVVLAPVVVSIRYAGRFLAAARLAEERASLERRAEEVLEQEALAPQRWSARLAPALLPDIEGFEVGTVYEPGTGAMAGDFYDLFATGSDRLVAAIGDVSGHGIEASITAFQVKYLLRVFLRQYRDPAQALEELNRLLWDQARPEEMVSLCVVLFDTRAGTLRYASAGHPPAYRWHANEVTPILSTGPLLRLEPQAEYSSREVELSSGDLLLLYTDGLAEARAGDSFFGEERVAGILRREAGLDVQTLCKTLRDTAREFADQPFGDDVAILGVRRT